MTTAPPVETMTETSVPKRVRSTRTVLVHPVDSPEARVTFSWDAANMNGLIADMVSEDEADVPSIPMNVVSFETLTRLAEFCEYFIDDPMERITEPLAPPLEAHLRPFYAKFVNGMTAADIVALTEVANYVENDPLMDLLGAKFSSLLHTKSPADVREIFGITKVFTPADEEFVRLNTIDRPPVVSPKSVVGRRPPDESKSESDWSGESATMGVTGTTEGSDGLV